MNETLLLAAHEKVRIAFDFLKQYGYDLSESIIKDDEVSEIVFTNKNNAKEINIATSNFDDVEKFFLNISIVRVPYLVVNDFVSFDTFIKKHGLMLPASLRKDERTLINANNYIDRYVSLFKQHGIQLIVTDEQHLGYFPEWT